MTTLTEQTLPTLDRLQASVPGDTDAREVATAWLEKLAKLLNAYAHEGHVQPSCLNSLFLPDATWRDTLALTWDYRTIYGKDAIHGLLNNCASSSGINVHPSTIATDPFYSPILSNPLRNISWIKFGFELKTAVGEGKGYARLVPTSDGSWKGYTIWTSLEALRDFTAPVSRFALLSFIHFFPNACTVVSSYSLSEYIP